VTSKPHVVIGDEQIVGPSALGPSGEAGWIVCNEHGHVEGQVLWCSEEEVLVCEKCVCRYCTIAWVENEADVGAPGKQTPQGTSRFAGLP
jgi:hypothetical protein